MQLLSLGFSCSFRYWDGDWARRAAISVSCRHWVPFVCGFGLTELLLDGTLQGRNLRRDQGSVESLTVLPVGSA
jgi:hypothetical protein